MKTQEKIIRILTSSCFIVAVSLVLALSLGLPACEGPVGPQGPAGPEGPVGPAGDDGSRIFTGTKPPTNDIGTIGDYYLNRKAGNLYGPKTENGWGKPLNLTGDDGMDGDDGSRIYSGTKAPPASLGKTGDYYLNTKTYDLYGPKTSKGWGQPINLQGPEGDPATVNAGTGLKLSGNTFSLNVGYTDNRYIRQRGFAISGTFTGQAIPDEGAGTRLMWYPAKSAFRAGIVEGTQWDDANTGVFSTAFGRNTIASGEASTALGENATASGLGSMAVGLPWAGIDPQYNPGATASGNGSVAIGHGALASGDASYAIGTTTVNTNGPTATGKGAFAIGPFDATATGEESFAIGHDVFAGADNSMAIGVDAAIATAHTGAIVIGTPLGHITSQGQNQFVVHAAHFWFGADEFAITYNSSHLLDTDTGAYLSNGGVWTNSSDSTKKEHYRPVNDAALLEKVASIPVQTWNYKVAADSVRHMGPTAQDFYDAFALGDSDKTIATIDIDGVNMAAIQALIKRTSTLQQQNELLTTRVKKLEHLLVQQGVVSWSPVLTKITGYTPALFLLLLLIGATMVNRSSRALNRD